MLYTNCPSVLQLFAMIIAPSVMVKQEAVSHQVLRVEKDKFDYFTNLRAFHRANGIDIEHSNKFLEF